MAFNHYWGIAKPQPERQMHIFDPGGSACKSAQGRGP